MPEKMKKNTDSKMKDDELRAASLYARSLIEASLDPFVTISPGGKITDVNNATEQMTGLTRERLIGSDFSNYFTEPKKARAGYKQVLSQGMVKDYPLAIRHSSGRIVDVLYNASVYKNEAGEVQGVFAAARDITERKRTEADLASAYDLIKDSLRLAHIGTWDWLIESDKVTWSEELYDIAGRDHSLPAPTYAELPRHYTPTSWESLSRAVKKALTTGEPYNLELELIRPDGSTRWTNAIGSVRLDGKGKVIGLHDMVQDITERKRMEHDVRVRMKELQAFYSLAEITEREGLTLDGLYQELTNILPNSWQYPEIAWARIVIGESEFRTGNFRESAWKQSAPVKVHESVVGRIEVGYLEERPELDEGPFQKEERQLIDAIAERIGRIIERKRLEERLEEMVNQRTLELTNVLKEVKGTVNVLTTAASEILAATTQVATSTAENAVAISETTTTVEEVRQAAQLSTQKAQSVSDSAQRVAQVGQTGQKAADDTVAVMRQIRDRMEAIARTIVGLSEQSQSIGGIIASVTDIADQSNLLAVNAAIEAARAGEHGKGFAVVAQEIKSLAEQSKQATAQVRNILGDIQKATNAAVMATEQGSKAADAGVKQSAQAGEAIRVLGESSGAAVQAAIQITASSQQQVVGMNQIAAAMTNINQAGQETAASMKQAEIAAKNLHNLGENLKDLVNRSKLVGQKSDD
ncbi:MAG: methyl-accepting chemotaxis protein [Methanomassiliicoccales archaeon]|nr:methyl-accepting chemotaxis protein [Methanomassiliicoccales archaeon]